MNRPLSLVLLVVGVVLLLYGVSASDSIGSGLSRYFTGSPTDRTLWLSIGGVAALILGAYGLFRGTKAV